MNLVYLLRKPIWNLSTSVGDIRTQQNVAATLEQAHTCVGTSISLQVTLRLQQPSAFKNSCFLYLKIQ